MGMGERGGNPSRHLPFWAGLCSRGGLRLAVALGASSFGLGVGLGGGVRLGQQELPSVDTHDQTRTRFAVLLPLVELQGALNEYRRLGGDVLGEGLTALAPDFEINGGEYVRK